MTGLRKSVSGAVLGFLWLAACGGGTSSPASGIQPNQASSNLAQVRRTAGVTPLASNAFPHALNCPELNSPTLTPRDQFMVAMANGNKACGLIDILILLTRASQAQKLLTAGRHHSADARDIAGSGY